MCPTHPETHSHTPSATTADVCFSLQSFIYRAIVLFGVTGTLSIGIDLSIKQFWWSDDDTFIYSPAAEHM